MGSHSAQDEESCFFFFLFNSFGESCFATGRLALVGNNWTLPSEFIVLKVGQSLDLFIGVSLLMSLQFRARYFLDYAVSLRDKTLLFSYSTAPLLYWSPRHKP